MGRSLYWIGARWLYMNVKKSIETKLAAQLSPQYLQVDNESAAHNVPTGSETHFKVVAVVADFEGKKPVARHQQVYRLLEHELKNGVHALALHLFSPAEWAQAAEKPLESPPCASVKKSHSAG